MGRLSIKPAVARQREGVVDLTTEVFVVLKPPDGNLDSLGVTRLVEPRGVTVEPGNPKESGSPSRRR